MGSVGLSVRVIPLLSSFACAIPGVMATRTIPDARDRLTTIMIAPLMTCSARLPVYALLIGAFIPQQQVWGVFELQGLVLFALYVAGIVSAMAVAFVLKRTVNRLHAQPLMMELPTYHWPSPRNLLIGLWQRAHIFLARVGTLILSITIILWALSSFPAAPPDFAGTPIEYSIAGRIGAALAPIFAPIGFNWQISIALVPGLAAPKSLQCLARCTRVRDGQRSSAALTRHCSNWSCAALSLPHGMYCAAVFGDVGRIEARTNLALSLTCGYLFALALLHRRLPHCVGVKRGHDTGWSICDRRPVLQRRLPRYRWERSASGCVHAICTSTWPARNALVCASRQGIPVENVHLIHAAH